MKRLKVLAASALLVSVAVPGATSVAAGADTPITVSIETPDDDDVVSAGGFEAAGTASVGDVTLPKDISIVYVVDVSGSTGATSNVNCDNDPAADSVLDCEKAALRTFQGQALESKLVKDWALVAFESTSPPTPPPADWVPQVALSADFTPEALADALDPLVPGGGTSYAAAVTAAATLLNASTSGTKIVVFLSDGVADDGDALPTNPFNDPLPVIRAFAISVNNGFDCAGDGAGPRLSLYDVAALGAPGSSGCTDVDDLSDLALALGESLPVINSVTATFDGAAVEVVTKPTDDPQAVTWEAQVTPLLDASDEPQLCVTATSDLIDATETECVTVDIVDTVIDCSGTTCTGTVGVPGTAQASFTGANIGDATLGLRVRETGPQECGGQPCKVGFDVVFGDPPATASTSAAPSQPAPLGQLVVTFERAKSTPPGLVQVYIDKDLTGSVVQLTQRCTGRTPTLPCYSANRVAGGRTEVTVKFGSDPGFGYR